MDMLISVLSVVIFMIVGMIGFLLFFGNYVAKLIGVICFAVLAIAYGCYGQTAAVPIALGLDCSVLLLAMTVGQHLNQRNKDSVASPF